MEPTTAVIDTGLTRIPDARVQQKASQPVIAGWVPVRRLLAHRLAERWVGRRSMSEPVSVLYRFDRHTTPARTPDLVHRFEALARFDHAHVLRVIRVEAGDDGCLWLSAADPGVRLGPLTLARLLAQRPGGTLQPSEASHAARHLLEGLRAAHDRGFAHGTLGMDDILIDPRGRAMIELLGVERALHAAPPIDAESVRADVRAVATIVYEALTGLPVTAERLAVRAVAGRRAAGWDRWMDRALGAAGGLESADEALRELPHG